MRIPAAVDAREDEWRELFAFATSGEPRATLGLVSGRVRMGKSTLLRTLAETTGGFYHRVTAVDYDGFLADLTEAVRAHTGAGHPAFTDLGQAVEALVALGAEREIPVVLDDLAQVNAPHDWLLTSIVKAVDGPGGRSSRARLLLGGSAVSADGRPLLRDRSLREHAALDLRLTGHDHRRMAKWWGIEDPAIAFSVYAVLGGTPVHRDWVDELPSGPGDMGPFTRRTVLRKGHPLFDAARRSLRHETGPFDLGFYRSISFNVAFGATRLDLLAKCVNRRPVDLRKHLSILTASGLLDRDRDLLSPGAVHYRIADQLFNFFMGMMRVDMGRIQRGYILEYLWRYRAVRYSDFIVNPQFAQVCRTWAKNYAPEGFFGGGRVWVGHGTVDEPGIDVPRRAPVVVLGEPVDGRPELRALGACRWDGPMDVADLAELRRTAALVRDAGTHHVGAPAFHCFGGSGFTPALRTAADRGEVTLVDTAALYSERT
ncbi:AAA family ATPase [Phytomonospora endophytica]|uniref:ATPase n=1 Tax=Phytomonospora endophytica TaxID=714109 RepID=A0A841FI94_9ACTN|nr:hypothetical protein [Phytomonospora endophytica]MBB6032847.1 hypothetical protein [Phytomonospora endophytica]GIG65073.1 hypothetical protein Pen01_13680 [Phytomonospora endophytica]